MLKEESYPSSVTLREVENSGTPKVPDELIQRLAVIVSSLFFTTSRGGQLLPPGCTWDFHHKFGKA